MNPPRPDIKNRWSDEAWAAAESVYQEILREPFVTELAQGTLPADKFDFYIRQDALYLNNYTRVLSHIASRLDDPAHIEAFLQFASTGMAVEKELHASFASSQDMARTRQSPTCLLYTSVQAAQATAPVEIEAAAILPCFWVYLEVGRHIAATMSAGNPYAKWINTYSDPFFEEATRRAIAICDDLADRCGPATRRAMTDMFCLCTRMEWLFWHSAYQLEQWKI